MIAIGSKFIVHWKGHETCYDGRVYQVKTILRGCTCPKPNYWYLDEDPVPRKPHIHLTADMIECPHVGIERGGYIFGGMDETTLIDLEDPTYRLEVVSSAGCQLSIF